MGNILGYLVYNFGRLNQCLEIWYFLHSHLSKSPIHPRTRGGVRAARAEALPADLGFWGFKYSSCP